MIPVAIITLARGIKPDLPLLASENHSPHHIVNPIVPAVMNAAEIRKYKGFDAYLTSREKIEKLTKNAQTVNASEIRAAFYVDWDPQSFYSLQKNIDKLNMVLPEWFFIDPTTDTLRPAIDTNALQLMKKNNIKNCSPYK
jgi:hypothetical protein